MSSRPHLFLSAALVLTAACAGDSDETAPAAPTGLTAAPLSGGAHLTWTDNSDNEVEFMVMRQQEGVDLEMLTIATVPFDTVQYHNAPLTSGQTYMFMVMAMNHSGETESNHVTLTAP